jgi:hypothetical protein
MQIPTTIARKLYRNLILIFRRRERLELTADEIRGIERLERFERSLPIFGSRHPFP